MNQFFISHGDVLFDIPRIAFARFDQCEPVDLVDAKEAVLAFSAVSADWYAEQTQDIYSLATDSPAPELWEQYWGTLFNKNNNNLPFNDPYGKMPLLRYEIRINAANDNFNRYREIVENEKVWLRIISNPQSTLEADVYGNLFGVAQTTTVSFKKVESHEARVLSSTFDMDTWPDASLDELKTALTTHKRAVALATFDVGQGSSSALLDDKQMPWLYHDLGAGVTRNAHTTPIPLEFCWTNDPVIVLSHWDSDHWAGARKDSRALARTWIAPRQIIGATHTVFANDILLAGGRLLIWPQGIGLITIYNTWKQSFTVGRCTGKDRNGTCLAMRVDDDKSGAKLHWLLTGDGGYHQLPFKLYGDVAAMVVPHHGAKMSGNRHIPQRSKNTYARLLFSFGPGNAHGPRSLSHPTQSAVYAHELHGWNLGTWKNKSHPGDTLAGGDVLATAQHVSTHLSGSIAGWKSAPTPNHRPCGKASCTTDIKQF
ncbi:hypothetical protein BMS3Abin11_02273 [bacterium BMS3Abin11]|nr:hypothetical protein BMS3Abin11_02273 [bacterium BMS3Abin11]